LLINCIFIRFKFTTLEVIVTNEKLKAGQTFDVIGIIKEEGKCSAVNVKSTGQDLDKKSILIYDNTKYGIELVLNLFG